MKVTPSIHEFVNGEGKCKCNFMLEWKHGPQAGKRSQVGIEQMCTIGSMKIDEEICLQEFLNSARKSVKPSLPKSDLDAVSFYIWVQNLETNISARAIRAFVKKHTAISSDVVVYLDGINDSTCRASISVRTVELAHVLLDFLCNTEQIVVSSKGRPWFLNEKKLKEMKLTSHFEHCSVAEDQWTELKLVHAGTAEYDRAREALESYTQGKSPASRKSM